MRKLQKQPDSSHKSGSSRRTFLKTAAGLAAGTVLAQRSPWAQSNLVNTDAGNSRSALLQIDQRFMITPDQALDWALFKSRGGPTYAGGTGWKRYTDFLIAKMPEFGAIDF